jgi:hypothetical protein
VKNDVPAPAENASKVNLLAALAQYAIVGMGSVAVLSWWIPLRVLHLFEGDYFASFLLIFGLALFALRVSSRRNPFSVAPDDSPPARPLYITLLVTAFGALLLLCLFTAWSDLTISEAWLNGGRWARFLPFVVAVFPYHAAEEMFLGPVAARRGLRRIASALALRVTAWAMLVAAIFVLHSGEVLLVLLVPFFALLCLFQRWGMDVVREVTGSFAAAALFGAILLAGFCLVAFPTT